jgi:hypothetical protein
MSLWCARDVALLAILPKGLGQNFQVAEQGRVDSSRCKHHSVICILILRYQNNYEPHV